MCFFLELESRKALTQFKQNESFSYLLANLVESSLHSLGPQGEEKRDGSPFRIINTGCSIILFISQLVIMY